jgi:hypothetical protein
MKNRVPCSLSRTAAMALSAGALLYAGGVAEAAQTDWSLRAIQLQYFNTEAGGWVPADIDVTVDTSTFDNGIKTFGTSADSQGGNSRAFALTGADWKGETSGENRGMRLIGIYDANVTQPWNNSTDSIVTHFKFNFASSAGAVDVYFVDSGYGMLGNGDADLYDLVGSSGYSQVFDLGTGEVDGQYVDRFNNPDNVAGDHIVGSFIANFDWSGFGEADTFEFMISPNSIDITVVPAPGAMAMMGLAGLAAAGRRRAR